MDIDPACCLVALDAPGVQGLSAVSAQVARRLLAAVRSGDLVARIGGDEFVVLCEDLRDSREAGVLLERLLQAFSGLFSVEDHDHGVTASLGVACADTPAASAETLLARADAAMYRAKHEGGGGWHMAVEGTSAGEVQPA